jgi:hypothetical protein
VLYEEAMHLNGSRDTSGEDEQTCPDAGGTARCCQSYAGTVRSLQDDLMTPCRRSPGRSSPSRVARVQIPQEVAKYVPASPPVEPHQRHPMVLQGKLALTRGCVIDLPGLLLRAANLTTSSDIHKFPSGAECPSPHDCQ